MLLSVVTGSHFTYGGWHKTGQSILVMNFWTKSAISLNWITAHRCYWCQYIPYTNTYDVTLSATSYLSPYWWKHTFSHGILPIFFVPFCVTNKFWPSLHKALSEEAYIGNTKENSSKQGAVVDYSLPPQSLMITLQTGVFVAIPSVFGYNFLLTQTTLMVIEAENFASDLADRIEVENKES